MPGHVNQTLHFVGFFAKFALLVRKKAIVAQRKECAFLVEKQRRVTNRDEGSVDFWGRVFKRFQQVFAEPSAWYGQTRMSAPAKKARRRLAPLQELEERCLLSVTPVGAEFRVNTHTQEAQQTFRKRRRPLPRM